MNVKQLIKKLESCDPSAMVVISGYEGGYNEAVACHEIGLKLNADAKWYDGKYDMVEYDDEQVHCLAISIL